MGSGEVLGNELEEPRCIESEQNRAQAYYTIKFKKIFNYCIDKIESISVTIQS